MKNIIVPLFVAAAIFTACKKEDARPAAPVIDPEDTTATEVHTGVFMNGPFGSTMGIARIYTQDNALSLVLDSFSVSSGPDLHVYLSMQVQPINFIDLGRLRANSGRQVYYITGMPDFTQYKYALIHCQQFNHLFGSAALQ